MRGQPANDVHSAAQALALTFGWRRGVCWCTLVPFSEIRLLVPSNPGQMASNMQRFRTHSGTRASVNSSTILDLQLTLHETPCFGAA